MLRDGGKHTVDSEKLVIGDVVFVKGGDRLPGDIRVIEAKSFKVGVTNSNSAVKLELQWNPVILNLLWTMEKVQSNESSRYPW